MSENTNTITSLSQKKDYIQSSNMKKDDTEVEIFAAATVLNTPIWTFSPYGTKHQWQCHNPIGTPATLPSTDRAIYLSNFGKHYNVVLAI